MKTILEENEKFDTRLEASDWRFSAAIVGLIEFFYEIDPLEEFYEINDDYIDYNSKILTKENYLKFVEKKYNDELHHKFVENRLQLDEFSDENIKTINEKLSGNTAMKKVFKKIKFDGSNKDEILNLIKENKETLILETFRNKKDMYANYCNTNQLFNDSQNYARLLGYCIDAGKKGKSIGFAFNQNSFVGQDIQEYDYIPFAFEGDRETFFINDNYEIRTLTKAKELLKRKIESEKGSDEKYKGARYSLFKGIMESSDFIENDVEVILKDRDKGYFETLYIRKQSIDILKKIKNGNVDYKSLCRSYPVNDKLYINIYKEAIEGILNNKFLDEIIDMLLKDGKYYYVVSQLIKINILIRGKTNMDEKMKRSINACAMEVSNKIQANKLESYKQKLLSSIVFKDYDRVSEVLLQLSSYSNVHFYFADYLFMDFEGNKEMVYTFINALGRKKSDDTNSSDK